MKKLLILIVCFIQINVIVHAQTIDQIVDQKIKVVDDKISNMNFDTAYSIKKTTTSNVLLVLDTLKVPLNDVVSYNFFFLLQNTSNNDIGSGEIEAIIKNINGTYSLIRVYNKIPYGAQTSLTSCKYNVSVVNNVARLSITGINGNVLWKITKTIKK